MSSSPVYSSKEFELVLYNCYQILKIEDQKMVIADLQLVFYQIYGRNLSRIAVAFGYKSIGSFIEKCPDIRVVMDTELKDVYAEIVSADVLNSSFRNKVVEYQDYAESLNTEERLNYSMSSTDLLPLSSEKGNVSFDSLDSNRASPLLKSPFRSTCKQDCSSLSIFSNKKKFSAETSIPPEYSRKPNTNPFQLQTSTVQIVKSCSVGTQTNIPTKELMIKPTYPEQKVNIDSKEVRSRMEVLQQAADCYLNSLSIPQLFKPQLIQAFTLNGINSLMLPYYVSNILELIQHLKKIEMLFNVNLRQLEIYRTRMNNY